MHYQRKRLKGSVETKFKSPPKKRYCKVNGCTNSYRCSGYCKKHYSAFKKYGDPLKTSEIPWNRKTPPKKCKIEGCHKDAKSLGWCNNHYQSHRKYKDPLRVEELKKNRLDKEQRFMSKVRKDLTGCWIWEGSMNKVNGYGQFYVDYRTPSAHRWSYAHFKGPIPPNHYVDHKCGVKLCVNPEHLDAVTPKQNTHRWMKCPSCQKLHLALIKQKQIPLS